MFREPLTFELSRPRRSLASPKFRYALGERRWCGREDSNFHVLSDTATSRLRVYQFRHGRTSLAASKRTRPVGAGR